MKQRASRTNTWARRWLLAILILTGTAAGARAQINDPSVKPVNIEMLPAKRPIVEYALAGGFLLAALAIGFKTTKRSGID